MKGVVLAGGTGSRLYPLTKLANKHLLPIYNHPMIYYPLYSLKEAGVTDVLIVSGRGHVGGFLELLGSGAQFGMNFSYEIQEKAMGIAHALDLAENFVGKDKFIVVLGDNIVEDNLSDSVKSFDSQEGAKVFLKSVKNPKAYGVAEVNADKIVSIEEKPENPKSDLAVIGVYMYGPEVFSFIKNLSPSDRNELEITDVNNMYLSEGLLDFEVLKGFWGDCGESFDSLIETSKLVRDSHFSKIDENFTLLR